MLILEELIIPALVAAFRLVVVLVADLLVELGLVGLVRRIRHRRLRAEARSWVEAGDWEAFRERCAAASDSERVVMLGVGEGHPELAELYAEAMDGRWGEVLQAVQVLRGRDDVPEVVLDAARAQLELGGMRAEMVRPLVGRDGASAAAAR